MQLFPADALLIEGKAVIAQVYVLVTSVSPLRIYRHRKGHAHLVAREQVTYLLGDFYPDGLVITSSMCSRKNK